MIVCSRRARQTRPFLPSLLSCTPAPSLSPGPPSQLWPLLVLKKSLALPPRLLTMPHPRTRPKTARSRESQSPFRISTFALYSDIPPLVSALAPRSPSRSSSSSSTSSGPLLLFCPSFAAPSQFRHHFFLSPASFRNEGRKFHVMRSTRSVENRANLDPLTIRRQSQSESPLSLTHVARAA